MYCISRETLIFVTVTKLAPNEKNIFIISGNQIMKLIVHFYVGCTLQCVAFDIESSTTVITSESGGHHRAQDIEKRKLTRAQKCTYPLHTCICIMQL